MEKINKKEIIKFLGILGVIIIICSNFLQMHFSSDTFVLYKLGYFNYPSEYFCPIDIVTKRLHITKNTRTIHHYAASWKDISKMDRIKSVLRSFLPDFILLLINHYKNKK